MIPTFRSRQSVRSLLTAAVSAAVTMAAGPVAAAPVLALMPMPRLVEQQKGALRLTTNLAPSVAGCQGSMVGGALARFRHDLVALTGLDAGGAPLAISIRCTAHDPDPLSIGAREGYRLNVSTKGVEIDADGEVGVLRALATLRQLVDRGTDGPMVRAVRVDDAPRFAWRGVMIDTARHFVEPDTLKRQLDAMERAKLNVLHLHLSDNEAFRVESRLYPRLAEVASHGQYYSQAEIRDLVAYAGERGIRIVPEFDMPGHSMALLTAYPELAAVPIDPKDPLVKPKSALNPASEKTYRFLERFLGEMTALFPDRQFHVGGDEVSDVAWKDSPEVAALQKSQRLAAKADVEAWFHERVRKILAAKGKTTIGWDEMAERPLPKDVIVQAWRSSNPVSTATAQGHRVIVSAGFYLSDLQSSDTHYAIDPLDPMAHSTMSAEVLAQVRRNPVTAAQVSDGLVARPVPPLTPDQEKLVIGGEAPLWAETVSDEMVDGRLWPRALAISERFWSPAERRDPIDMYARLLPAMDALRAQGLQDDAHRQRMIARLAPEAPEVVAPLVGAVAPARLFANHVEAMMTGRAPDLVELVDAASTDGTAARRFRVNVDAYLAGDRTRAPFLRRELVLWTEALAPFEALASGRPLLEKAVPTARDLAALGSLGQKALVALETGSWLSDQDRTAGRALLAKLKDFDDASKDLGAISRMKQPPAALIISPHVDVARLFERAVEAAR